MNAPHDLDALGYTPDQVSILNGLTRLPPGIAIVEGPTRSGMSTPLSSTMSGEDGNILANTAKAEGRV